MFRNAYSAGLLCALCQILAITFLDVSAIHVATTVPKNVQEILKKTNVTQVRNLLNNSRRIVGGVESLTTRPYMVFLRLPTNNPKKKDYMRWLCGGVIVHEEYVLTSAACIEDARNFYIVSGTFQHTEDAGRHNNLCMKNGAKKAIWKCVPRNYVFDGHENDNIRWMNNDIAVVKVEDEFDFHRRVRGCDFVPKPICYNNQSLSFEEPGNTGSIAGWGTTLKYNDWVNTRKQGLNKVELRETNVKIIGKNKCKRRWGARYYNIIDNYMICTKDLIPDMSRLCEEKYVDCTDVMYSDDELESKSRRVISPESLQLHNPFHNDTRRNKARGEGSGGFCENDHGGPLVVGEGVNAMVIGIISACLVKDRTNECYGPFLYTSVFRNKILLDCAIFKDIAGDCSKNYRSSITHTETVLSWIDHPDGPSKNELVEIRRMEEAKRVAMINTNTTGLGNISRSLHDNQTGLANLTQSLNDNSKRLANITHSLDGNKARSADSHDTNRTADLTHAALKHQAQDTSVQHGGVILRTFENRTVSES